MPERGPLDIAVVGMAARYADAPDLGAFWGNILDRHEALRAAPADWDLGSHVPETSLPHRIPTNVGGFLRGELRFDPVARAVPPSIVADNRPDCFMALQLAHEALEDAGLPADRRDPDRVGIVLGNIHLSEHQELAGMLQQFGVDLIMKVLGDLAPDHPAGQAADLEARLREQLCVIHPDRLPAMVPSMISGLAANRLDLRGPCFTVDAACASAVVALEQACGLLRRGSCDQVLTGGIQFSVGPQQVGAFAQLGALAASRVRPFAQEAEGTLLGEGGAILVLKRRADAERDGDRIYALVQGVGLSSDGTSQGLLTPSLEGEARAIRWAWEESGLDPSRLGLVEAHGTGIPVGDATELEALQDFHRQHRAGGPPCALGAVKSMIGHCLAASGAAGLVKAAMAIHHRVLPPTLADRPRPELEDAGLFYLNTAPRPWIEGEGRRVASVSAFGFGGCNAHAVLEEWRPSGRDFFAGFLDRAPPAPPRAPGRQDWPVELFLFEAADPGQLASQVRDFRAEVEAGPEQSLRAWAQEAWSRRGRGRSRWAFLAKDAQDLQRRLEVGPGEPQADAQNLRARFAAAAPGGKLAMLFPGEASQRPGALGDLLLHFPRLGEWLDALVALHDEDLPAGEASLATLLFPRAGGAGAALDPAGLRQFEASRAGSMAVWATSFGLVELLGEVGLRAEGLLGHSAGDVLARVQAGAFGPPGRRRACEAVMTNLRGLADLERDRSLPACRGVAVGGLGLDEVEQLLGRFDGALHLAMDNCPSQQVVFGPEPQLAAFEDQVREAGGILFPVPMARPFHTPLYAAGTAQCREVLATVELHPPQVPLYSCVTASPYPSDPEGFLDVCARQWTERVRLRETLLRMYEDGFRVFLEVGPGAKLGAFARDTLRGTDALILSCDPPRGAGLESFLDLLGQLHVHGLDLDAGALFRGRAEGPTGPAGSVFRTPRIDLELPADSVASLRETIRAGPAPEDPPGELPPGRRALAARHFQLMEDILAQQERALALLEAAEEGGNPHE